jgi:F-type H+-transporting ATPase subunit delta
LASSSILIKRYVSALFAVAKGKGQIEETYRCLATLDEEFQLVPDLKDFILSPEHSSSQKNKVLLTALDGDIPDLLKRFIQLVLNKKRVEILPAVYQAFHRFREEALGHVQAEVVTAIPLSAEMQQEISEVIAKLTSKSPIINWEVNPELLGGYRIQVEDRCYDFSLLRQLINLREQMSS